MKITKNRYLLGFSIVVVLLALVRIIFPSVDSDTTEKTAQTQVKDSLSAKDDKKPEKVAHVKKVKKLKPVAKTSRIDSVNREKNSQSSPVTKPAKKTAATKPATKSSKNAAVSSPFPIPVPNFFDSDYNEIKNRINSVPSYAKAFPDGQDLQIKAANKYGVSPVQNRSDAEQRKSELVYVGASPYYHIDKLQRSIPYLVPRAAVLLNDIGRAFFDSLQIKGVPLNQIIVTSVLRSRDDVKKLSNYNSNATENSCHLYGTTFDICYNRYKTVSDPDFPPRRAVRNDTLKWVLSEVLRDMRENNRCYVKYEVKQGCFHITVR